VVGPLIRPRKIEVCPPATMPLKPHKRQVRVEYREDLAEWTYIRLWIPMEASLLREKLGQIEEETRELGENDDPRIARGLAMIAQGMESLILADEGAPATNVVERET